MYFEYFDRFRFPVVEFASATAKLALYKRVLRKDSSDTLQMTDFCDCPGKNMTLNKDCDSICDTVQREFLQ